MSTERIRGGGMKHIYAAIWADGVRDLKKAENQLRVKDTSAVLIRLAGMAVSALAAVSGVAGGIDMATSTDVHHGSYQDGRRELGRAARLIMDPDYRIEIPNADGTVELVRGTDPNAPIKVLRKVKGVGNEEVNSVLADTRDRLRSVEADSTKLALVTQATDIVQTRDRAAEAQRQKDFDNGWSRMKNSGIGLLGGIGAWITGSLLRRDVDYKYEALRRRKK